MSKIGLEYIGSELEVIDSKNKSLIGLKGKVIDETKNTFIIAHDKKTKNILKNNVKLRIKMKNETFEIEGRLLVGRPEDRIKKDE